MRDPREARALVRAGREPQGVGARRGRTESFGVQSGARRGWAGSPGVQCGPPRSRSCGTAKGSWLAGTEGAVGAWALTRMLSPQEAVGRTSGEPGRMGGTAGQEPGDPRGG